MDFFTKLDAVNQILSLQGIAPVDSLNSGDPMAETAEQYLDKTNRLVQLGEWTFNREDDFPLTPAPDGTITVPAHLRLTITEWDGGSYVVRGGKLYDRRAHSFQIGKTLKASITWLLDWEDLPASAKHYIGIYAARWYQREQLGSDSIEKLSQQDEAAALRVLRSDDADLAHYNVLDNPALWDITHR